MAADTAQLDKITALPCWLGTPKIMPLQGGITNHNFTVSDLRRTYVVRLGADIQAHGIMRFNELAASQAAEKAGISPRVVYHEHGILVLDFIEGRTLSAADMRANPMPALDLIASAHREMAVHLQGPLLTFWPFHVVHNYLTALQKMDSKRCANFGALWPRIGHLRSIVGQIELTYCHNDLLAANFIDDGKRLWLIDWDYAGFNSPLFDLANFATNSELDEAGERAILARYFGRAPDALLLQQFNAMRCMSLLREALWSMMSEITSTIEFDYETYTDAYLQRFDAAWTRVAG